MDQKKIYGEGKDEEEIPLQAYLLANLTEAFSQWTSPFPDDPSLCQGDNTLTSTLWDTLGSNWTLLFQDIRGVCKQEWRLGSREKKAKGEASYLASDLQSGDRSSGIAGRSLGERGVGGWTYLQP